MGSVARIGTSRCKDDPMAYTSDMGAIEVSAKAWDRLVEAMDRPAIPNRNLRREMRRYFALMEQRG